MRRLVVVLVIALLGAGFAGRIVSADGARVGTASVSSPTLRAELAVIHSHPQYACYLAGLYSMDVSSTSTAFSAKGSATWTGTQVEGLSIRNYAIRHLHWSPSSVNYATATTEYANELTNAAASAAVSCATSATSAVAHLPKWFLRDQLLNEAASVYVVSHGAGVYPTTLAGLHAYYNAHPDYYQTICVSVAVVPVANVNQFEAAREQGASITQLAHEFSVESQVALGCYGPTSTAYTSVRADTYGNPLNQFPASYHPYNNNGSEEALYVAATSTTPASFSESAPIVLEDVRAHNQNIALQSQSAVLGSEHVFVDPAFGVWSPTKLKVSTLSTPRASVTPGGGSALGL